MRRVNLLFFFLSFAEGGEVKICPRVRRRGGVESLGHLPVAAAAALDDSVPVAGAA
jgi:hypothetical protein